MPTIKKHGRKYRIQFRFNGHRCNVTVPQQIPVEFHEKLETQFDSLVSEITSSESGPVDRSYLERQFLSLYQSHLEKNRGLQSIPALSEQWLAQLELRPNTIEGYRRTAKHLIEFFRSMTISQIRDSLIHIQKYVDFRKAQDVCRQTIVRELTTLNLLFQFAELPGISRKQLRLPAEKSMKQFHSLTQGTNGRKVLLSEAEIEELMGICSRKGSQLIADAVLFVAYTGCRRSEVTRLKASDIDLARGTITLTSYKKVKGVDTPTVIPIHERLRPMLERRIECEPLLFTRSIDTLTSGLKKAIQESKFDKKGFGFHVLRHTLATRLIQKNVPVTSVSRILGHSQVSTTLNIYSHALMNDLRSAFEMI